MTLSLKALCAKYQGNGYNCLEGTDKGSAHSYVDVYEDIFCDLRDKPVRMLEIGVCSGGSTAVWSEYFTHPSAEIIGVDVNLSSIVPACDRRGQDMRLRIEQMDGTDPRTAETLGGQFDIVIDDGSHFPQHQMESMRIFHSRVKPGGYYIIEDILDIRNASIFADIFLQKIGWECVLHDRRHIKNDPNDVMIVAKRPA